MKCEKASIILTLMLLKLWTTVLWNLILANLHSLPLLNSEVLRDTGTATISFNKWRMCMIVWFQRCAIVLSTVISLITAVAMQRNEKMALMPRKWMLSGLGKVFMRNTVIKNKNGFTGPYYDSSVKGMVQIGSEQSLTYTTETDLKLEPFHLSNSDRESMRADSFVDLLPDKHVSKNCQSLRSLRNLWQQNMEK